MNKIYVVSVCMLLICCSNSKKKPNEALEYNEKLVSLVNKVDSTRNLLGDREAEPLAELNADLLTYKTCVDQSLQKLEGITFSKDTAFKNEVTRYILLNKGFSETDFPNLLKLKAKLDTDTTAKKEEIYYLINAISEEMNKHLMAFNGKVAVAQRNFAKVNKISLN